MDKKTAIQYLNRTELVNMATIEGEEPRVRLMSLIHYDDKVYTCTIAGREKIDQIELNNKFECNTTIDLPNNKKSQLRIRGQLIKIDKLDCKKRVSSTIKWFNQYWKGYEDPNFILYQLRIKQLITQEPGMVNSYKI